jgi:RimJ/RimL family protein N-acetyltransferase
VLPVEISDGGLLMRPWQAADAPVVAAALADPAIALWNPSAGGMDLDAAIDWVERRADWSDGGHASFAIVDGTGGPVLGSVSLHRINWQMQDAAIGYWTVRAARGRGIAGRAVNAVTVWAFETLDLYRVELCHAVANAASCRVAAKAGFLLEGTLREAYRYGDGKRHDEHLHARLATDPHPAIRPGKPSRAITRGR